MAMAWAFRLNFVARSGNAPCRTLETNGEKRKYEESDLQLNVARPHCLLQSSGWHR